MRSVDAPVPFSTILEDKSLGNKANYNKDIEKELLSLQKSMNHENILANKQEQPNAEKKNSEGRLIEIEDESNVTASLEVTHPKELINNGASTSAKNSCKTTHSVKIPCAMCEEIISCEVYTDSTPRQMYEMVSHLEDVHEQRMCPVCSTLFDTRLPIFDTYFNNHVQQHFRNDSEYPPIM